MNTSNEAPNNEIDFIELIQTIWNGKWIIILLTLISTIIGILVYHFKDHSHDITTPLHKGNVSTFLKYVPLNTILAENPLPFGTEKEIEYFKVNADYIFNLFLNEFNDSNEIIEVLEKNEYVQVLLQDMNEKEKNKKITELAKLFYINAELKNVDLEIFEWTFNIKWHDPDEAITILNSSIKKVLYNVQNRLINDLSAFSKSTNAIQKRKAKKLKILLKSLEQRIDMEFNKYILYLKSQSKIAKELKIKDRNVNLDTLNNFNNKHLSLNLGSNRQPYYLRGYVAIDKEIKVISDLDIKEKMLISNLIVNVNKNTYKDSSKIKMNYSEIINDLSFINLDDTFKELNAFIPLIKNDNVFSWINYNTKRSDVETESKLYVFIFLSFILGFFTGVILILYNAAVSRRNLVNK